jgi:hypothetical protein
MFGSYLPPVVCTIVIWSNMKYLTYFSRENLDLKYFINPLFVIDSGVKYTKKNYFPNKKEKFKVIGDDAVISDIKKQKTVGIFIVGETARADKILFLLSMKKVCRLIFTNHNNKIGIKAKIPICIINEIDSNSSASLVFCSLMLSIILVSIN